MKKISLLIFPFLVAICFFVIAPVKSYAYTMPTSRGWSIPIYVTNNAQQVILEDECRLGFYSKIPDVGDGFLAIEFWMPSTLDVAGHVFEYPYGVDSFRMNHFDDLSIPMENKNYTYNWTDFDGNTYQSTLAIYCQNLTISGRSVRHTSITLPCMDSYVAFNSIYGLSDFARGTGKYSGYVEFLEEIYNYHLYDNFDWDTFVDMYVPSSVIVETNLSPSETVDNVISSSIKDLQKKVEEVNVNITELNNRMDSIENKIDSILVGTKDDQDKFNEAQGTINDINDKLNDVGDALDSYEKPDINVDDYKLENIVNIDFFNTDTAFFAILANNSIISVMIFASFSLALIAFVFFGKR